MGEALAAAGREVDSLGRDEETLRRVGVFVELHVEQGRCLVEQGRAVGVASSIWPHGRWRLDLDGVANHAGTTRLEDRHDPMLALAAAITEARAAAYRQSCVATIGKVAVSPNGVNAIPDRVTAWLDARGETEAQPRAVAAAVATAAGTEVVEESFTPSTDFDPALAGRLASLLEDAPVLGTGAGHDAGILSLAGVATAMLFVRNPSGVSHSPAEHAERDDCLAGVEALTRVLTELATT
jgi:N-carbamoyl-L-amino-acid hydrolase